MKCKYCGNDFNAKNAIFCSEKCSTYHSTELSNKTSLKSITVSIKMNQVVSDSLREIRSNLIQNATENISFSYVVNLVLKEGLKNKKLVSDVLSSMR